MKRIYQAANTIEAHMIVHLLGQVGIPAHVQGEHLQSGAGELPLGDLVAVAVADEDADAARRVVAEWEAQTPPVEQPRPVQAATPQLPVLTFFIGALLGGFIAWSMSNGSQSASGVDCKPAVAER